MRPPIPPPEPTLWDAKALDLCAKFPRAWAAFCRLTFEKINVGRTRVGAKSVWEDMRWEADVAMREHAEDWALNNSLTASFSRLFMAAYPEHPVFETRTRPTERKAA